MSGITWDQISEAGIDTSLVEFSENTDLYTLTRPSGGRVVFGDCEGTDDIPAGGYDLAVYDDEDAVERQEYAETVPGILKIVAGYQS